MQTNWEALVTPASDHDAVSPCVLCGDMQMRMHRLVSVAFLRGLLTADHNIFRNTALQDPIDNILIQLEWNIGAAWPELIDSADAVEQCKCCINCFHWMTRSKNALPPLMHLRWYLYTLENTRRKPLDKRVVRRICRTLTQTYNGHTNFYRTMFSDRELCLFEKIGEDASVHSTTEIARLHHALVAHSLFSKNRDATHFSRQMEDEVTKVDVVANYA
jgi:hypothetical protein